MDMVILQRSRNLAIFRQYSSRVLPLVSMEDPHWPAVELPPCAAPGILGYASDLVCMVPGYERFKSTVARCIVGRLKVFDTDAAATPLPYVTMDDVVSPDKALDVCLLCHAASH
ncbi:Aste57867_8211 [Aphanomyces stellatus]|uniref:Aste57867_8211 protein n=1 Tax=Aphanomyces stellatus TaxID=120398 RepID=A0A485KJM1_9STRA|nr:hypothetical protein As57867_008180 [Aphanomyces stellatus]VFT85098.1 Aste57867_8211 [Aphanomyces stellatus]